MRVLPEGRHDRGLILTRPHPTLLRRATFSREREKERTARAPVHPAAGKTTTRVLLRLDGRRWPDAVGSDEGGEGEGGTVGASF